MTPTTTRRHAAPWPVGNSGRQQGDASWRGDGFPFSAACVGSPGHRRGRFPRGDGEPATLGEIEAIRNAWGVDVCEDPVDVERWSPLNPSRGQCGPTALVVHDLLGGWLCVAKVRLEDGSYQGYHWWNRLPGGVDIDLTRDQFAAGESLEEPRVFERPPKIRRGEPQYLLLRARVFESLTPHTPAP